MKILDFINEKTNNAYKDFKLVSVIFDEKTKECVFKFLYKDAIKEQDKDTLKQYISEYLNADVNIIVKCKKAYIDSDLVKDILYNFITRNFASIGIDFQKKNISVSINDAINTTIKCNQFQYDYLSNSDTKKEIIDYAENFFFESFLLELKLDNNEKVIDEEIINDNLLTAIYSDQKESEFKFHKVTNIDNIIGETVGSPMHISCIKSSMDNIEIVGLLKFLTERSFESKRKDKNGESLIRTYYSFTVVGKTGKMNCVLFPNKTDMAKSSELQEDKTVLVHGDVEEFNGRRNFKVKSIAYCDIVEEIEKDEVIEYKKEPLDSYICVKPEPHVEMFQDNLFAKSDEIGQYLLDNDVVVFDIETTGLEAAHCEILEIGAVKIHKGKIIETFETLIKPKGPIPDEITELTGITYDMVSNSPSLQQVMPDFYKFCYGTTIMAYNIDFDYKFINLYGKKQGYLFDMKQIDAMFLARSFIPGLKNFKLSSVCKKLGVSLENAHRAVHDAMATAEVVIKLSPNIT